LTDRATSRTILAMRRHSRDPARRLRIAVERLPRHTKEAMLRGIDTNRIIVGAYVDPQSGGVCPMLAAHRNGGRTNVASFARAWDEYTGARRRRRATRREVRTLRTLLESSLNLDPAIEHGSIAELAAQIRAERAELARLARPSAPSSAPAEPRVTVPESEDATICVRRRIPASDLLSATERELANRPAPNPPAERREPAEPAPPA
jgi:hypothetical protein